MFKRKRPQVDVSENSPADMIKHVPAGIRKFLPPEVNEFFEAAQAPPPDPHLLANGARGQGVVSQHQTIARSQFGSESWYTVHVRFRFDDGTETEITQSCTREKVGILDIGDKVPIRFDPQNHSAVVLDIPALEARHQEMIAAAGAAHQQADQEKIARAQAEIDQRRQEPGDWTF